MSYAIHIKWPEQPDGKPTTIPLSEWREAVEATEGVRLSSGDWISHPPGGGTYNSGPGAGGDAEVFDPEADTWIRIFRWAPPGQVAFRSEEFYPGSPIYLASIALASALGAQVVGDEGETYDEDL